MINKNYLLSFFFVCFIKWAYCFFLLCFFKRNTKTARVNPNIFQWFTLSHSEIWVLSKMTHIYSCDVNNLLSGTLTCIKHWIQYWPCWCVWTDYMLDRIAGIQGRHAPGDTSQHHMCTNGSFWQNFAFALWLEWVALMLGFEACYWIQSCGQVTCQANNLLKSHGGGSNLHFKINTDKLKVHIKTPSYQ